MRICHVSPHLPPDQAANALLPAQLGWMAVSVVVPYLVFVVRRAETAAHPSGECVGTPMVAVEL